MARHVPGPSSQRAGSQRAARSPVGAPRRGPAKRARRTQAERTAATRERILDAVVASIAELGFQRTTASEIARRAGVTWGAVQHHFGGKDGILEAVLEDSFARLAQRLAAVPAAAPLPARVELFVARAWEHFASPHYRSTLEILLHLTPADRKAGWQGEMQRELDGIWRRTFPEARLPRRGALALQRYTASVLSGLAALALLDGGRAARAAELRLLVATLLRELSTGAATLENPPA
jgi:AcrR family transcriptional regulator